MNKIVGYKKCPVCGQEYPIDKDGFCIAEDGVYTSCCDESDLIEDYVEQNAGGI